MQFVGMDVGQVRSAAERVRAGRERLADTLGALEGTVQRSHEFWIGSDGETFRAQWGDVYTTVAQQALAGLENSSRVLEADADEQDAASSGAAEVGSVNGGAVDGRGAGGGQQDVVYEGDDPRDRGTVDPDVASAWRAMDPEDKHDHHEKVAQEIVNAEFERYGLEPVDISFEEMDGNGYWREGFLGLGRKLAINEDMISDPAILHTLAHEARHAAQHEFISQTDRGLIDVIMGNEKVEDYARIEEEFGFTREEIDTWRENFDDYHSPPDALDDDASAEEQQEYRDAFDRYLDQPVEVDARRGGREFVEGLTLEDLQRYQKAAGVPVSKGP